MLVRQMFFVARIADRRFLDLPPSLTFIYYFLCPLRFDQQMELAVSSGCCGQLARQKVDLL